MSQEEANRIIRAVQRVRSSRVGVRLALPTVAALGAGTALAIGSIPSGDGTITGCYLTSTDAAPLRYGALRVIDPSQTPPAGGPTDASACRQDEVTITWSQRGPQGPQGPAGGQGAAGSPLIGETSFGLKNSGGKTFLKLDGIKGESIDKVHKAEIDIESFSFSAGGGQHASGGGGGTGKVNVQTFTITKKLDKSSPLLFQAAATGKHIKLATLSFARKVKGKQQDYLQFKFTNALVSSIQDGTSHGNSPQEQVTFAFQKVNESFLGANHKIIQTVSITISGNKGA
jgi:type VI secretion system secreted protein Hcp